MADTNSEHDESEFYYPDEMSDAEIIESMVNLESNLLKENEVQNYIRGQQQNSTVKKTKYDMNVFNRFLEEAGEDRQIENIPPKELDNLLSNFYIKAKKKDNTLYEPDTMSAFSRSIQRHLDDKNARFNILKDEEFKLSRQVLRSKRRELRKEGKENKPNATVALEAEDIESIFKANNFGVHDPEVLSRTMWFLLTLHFGHRARHEARQLKFGDIHLKRDERVNEEYLEWSMERESKTRHGDENEHQRSFRPRAYETGDEKCPVACYKQFVYRRPEEAKHPESPFFLTVKQRLKSDEQVWFTNRPMGKNKIGKFLSQATKDLLFTKSKSGKITNHSVRKTCIKSLLDAGVSHNNVAQLSGHKSLKSLDSYAVASESQQRNMSKVLSGSTAKDIKPSKHENKMPCPLPQPSSSLNPNSLFSQASIGVLNIHNLVLLGDDQFSTSCLLEKPKKRRYVIHSSDEED